jgi:hypothetical protein
LSRANRKELPRMMCCFPLESCMSKPEQTSLFPDAPAALIETSGLVLGTAKAAEPSQTSHAIRRTGPRKPKPKPHQQSSAVPDDSKGEAPTDRFYTPSEAAEVYLSVRKVAERFSVSVQFPEAGGDHGGHHPLAPQ